MINTFVYVILLTIWYTIWPSHSGIPNQFLIPVVSTLITSYSQGDWNANPLFYGSIFATSYAITAMLALPQTAIRSL